MDFNCEDSFGRGALTLAIDGENLEMVELLIIMGVETKDALLEAINQEFVEAVELLLEHEELIRKEGELYVRLCRRQISRKPHLHLNFIDSLGRKSTSTRLSIRRKSHRWFSRLTGIIMRSLNYFLIEARRFRSHTTSNVPATIA